MTSPAIRLTEYSHGAGCGYKISPKVLDTILHSTHEKLIDPRLLVGNETRDDTAVYDIGNDVGIINTTDFFMSIVDDSFDFGCIAAPTPLAISTPWGNPIMASAILGWPIATLLAEVAQRVVDGGVPPASRRAFHRRARTDLWPGCHWRGQYRTGEEKQHRAGRINTVPH